MFLFTTEKRLHACEDALEEMALIIDEQDAEVARLREALEVALKTIDYAVGCIEGTIRDYKDELSKKLYEAREALQSTG